MFENLRKRRCGPSALLLLLLILLSDLFCVPSRTQTATPPYYTNSSSSPSSPRVTVAEVASLHPGSPGELPLCRDRLGFFLPEDFQSWTCGFCLNYLYTNKPVHVYFDYRLRLLVFTNASKHRVDTVRPDISNASDVSKVCRGLESAGQDCQRWKDCCHAAKNCCDLQQSLRAESTAPGVGSSSGGREAGKSGYCPATWDGYRCWEATKPGSTVSTRCAGYIEHATTDDRASLN